MLEVEQDGAAIVMRLGKAGMQRQCALGTGARFVQPLHGLQGQGAIVPDVGKTGRHGKRTVIGRQGFIVPFQVRQCGAIGDQRFNMPGIVRQRLRGSRQGVFQPSQVTQHDRAPAHHRDIIRLDHQRALINLQRLAEAAGRPQQVAIVGQHLGRVRLHRQRLADQLQRLGTPPLLRPCHAQQVIGLRLARRLDHQLQVQSLCLRQIAALVKADSLVQEALAVHVRSRP